MNTFKGFQINIIELTTERDGGENKLQKLGRDLES